jgi:peptidoglycan/LPS O-acetylase OafA/YrhL
VAVDLTGAAPTLTPSRTRGPARGARRDVQALRAIAVVAVVLYHLWPVRLPGGYVGVDVFFVISGFLITLHLLRSPVRRPADMLDFWARRVRRLLPAATVVLALTVLAGALWLPETTHAELAKEVAASSLYVENWVLAASSTNYLDQGQLHSAVQHFWSLSVEEQFYLVWPILVTAVVVVARRLGRRGRVTAVVGMAALAVASFVWSVVYTHADAPAAYFVSTTRVWELALGGVVAALVSAAFAPRRRGVRLVCVWLGLALVAYAVVTFDAATPFPGSAALVPTGGAALVILAASDDLAGGPRRLWSVRPVQWVGDVSYSFYLWHWPVLVIAPFALGVGLLHWPVKLTLLAASVALAGLSKHWLEDRVRFHPAVARSTPRSFVLLLVCLALSLGSAGALGWSVHVARERAAAPLDTSAPCFGAASFRSSSCTPDQRTGATSMSPIVAKDDKPDVYADDCWANRPFTGRTVCHYGRVGASTRVAVVGNSHAGQWQPPLDAAARARGWAVDTYLASECYTVDVPIEFHNQRLTDNCADYNGWAVDTIAAGRYDVVVMADRTTTAGLQGVPADRKSAVAEAAYGRAIDRFVASGAQVLVIRDTPSHPAVVPDCVAETSDPAADCSAPRGSALEDDPLATAATNASRDHVGVLDVSDLMCDATRCYGVVGGVIAYFDYGHLTKAFSLTMEPEIEKAVGERLAAGSRTR